MQTRTGSPNIFVRWPQAITQQSEGRTGLDCIVENIMRCNQRRTLILPASSGNASTRLAMKILHQMPTSPLRNRDSWSSCRIIRSTCW